MLRHTSICSQSKENILMMTYASDTNLIKFRSVLTFLKEHQWLYNYPNTHILVNKVLHNFKSEWTPYLKEITNDELNALPFGGVNPTWPASLKQFIKQIQDLKYEVEIYKLKFGFVNLPATSGVSAKKAHEIAALAAVIHDICEEQNISFIIDVGAGLGYLSQLLYAQYNYNVLGIEGDLKNYELALKNQDINSKNHVKYLHHFITENSANNIKQLLQENFSSWNENIDKVCITGLHACADLSVTILEIFAKLEFVTSLIIMPCCYHRLELQDVSYTEEQFKNFPASRIFDAVYKDLQGEFFLRRPFLRLACQQTSGTWKNLSAAEHEKHSRSCIFRAIVQEVSNEANLDLKRLKRKTGKFKSDSNFSIEDYVNNLKHTHKLVPKEGAEGHKEQLIDDDEFKSKIFEKWNEHKENCYLVEILTAFQTAIQSICENVILLDRVEFLREKGLQCNIYKVTDDRISPRCHTLVATKR